MRPLKELCLQAIWRNLDNGNISGRVHQLPPALKSLLLERALCHDKMKDCLLSANFLYDLTRLHIPDTKELTDAVLRAISVACGKLNSLKVVVPLLTPRSQVRVSSSGLAAVVAHQDELEEVEIVWCRGFQSGVINRIRSVESDR